MICFMLFISLRSCYQINVWSKQPSWFMTLIIYCRIKTKDKSFRQSAVGNRPNNYLQNLHILNVRKIVTYMHKFIRAKEHHLDAIALVTLNWDKPRWINSNHILFKVWIIVLSVLCSLIYTRLIATLVLMKQFTDLKEYDRHIFRQSMLSDKFGYRNNDLLKACSWRSCTGYQTICVLIWMFSKFVGVLACFTDTPLYVVVSV